MLKVVREESTVKIKVTIPVPGAGDWNYEFSWSTSSVAYAGLLRQAIIDALSAHTAKMMNEGYEAGYKDGRAKRRSNPMFGGRWYG